MHERKMISAGEDPVPGNKIILMMHGRGGSAEDILSLASHLPLEDFALLAPQATGFSWYPFSFMAPDRQNEPWLSSALNWLKDEVNTLLDAGVPSTDIYFTGFSQGACLTLEFLARNARHYGGAMAFTGGLIGQMINNQNYSGDFAGTPVFISTGDPDPHVPLERVEATRGLLQNMGAKVELNVYKGKPHSISPEELQLAEKWVLNTRK